MDKRFSHSLVIDLEATCWKPEDPERAQSEIIEIGLVILGPNLEDLWSGGWFVRPKLHPRLSKFCTELTSITQADVDEAPDFPGVMSLLEEQVARSTGGTSCDALFVSWGNYDRRQLRQDCELHGYEYPFGEHMNLKERFMRAHKVKKAGMTAALQLLGLPHQGTHHRGADDARNIARIFQAEAGRLSMR